MEIKVGIQHVNREIVVESSESAADVEKELLSSIGTGGDGVFTVTDERGRKVLIPVCRRSPTSISVRRTPVTSASALFDLDLFARAIARGSAAVVVARRGKNASARSSSVRRRAISRRSRIRAR